MATTKTKVKLSLYEQAEEILEDHNSGVSVSPKSLEVFALLGWDSAMIREQANRRKMVAGHQQLLRGDNRMDRDLLASSDAKLEEIAKDSWAAKDKIAANAKEIARLKTESAALEKDLKEHAVSIEQIRRAVVALRDRRLWRVDQVQAHQLHSETVDNEFRLELQESLRAERGLVGNDRVEAENATNAIRARMNARKREFMDSIADQYLK